MESLEEVVTGLGAVPPVRCREVGDVNVTMVWLGCTGQAILLAPQVYGDHCTKVVWQIAFATMHKAGCGHLDSLVDRAMSVTTTKEVVTRHRQTRRASNTFF